LLTVELRSKRSRQFLTTNSEILQDGATHLPHTISRMIRIRRAFPSPLFALSFVTTAAAQLGGNLFGVIEDPSGAVLPGVSVTATDAAPGTVFKTTTDGQGLYSFPRLPVARFEVTIQTDGFKPRRRTGLQN
jgi:hypothetical protein